MCYKTTLRAAEPGKLGVAGEKFIRGSWCDEQDLSCKADKAHSLQPRCAAQRAGLC